PGHPENECKQGNLGQGAGPDRAVRNGTPAGGFRPFLSWRPGRPVPGLCPGHRCRAPPGGVDHRLGPPCSSCGPLGPVPLGDCVLSLAKRTADRGTPWDRLLVAYIWDPLSYTHVPGGAVPGPLPG